MDIGAQFTSSIAGVTFVYRCVGHTLDGTPIVVITNAVEPENEHKSERGKKHQRTKGQKPDA